jgi:hypothetical protein
MYHPSERSLSRSTTPDAPDSEFHDASTRGHDREGAGGDPVLGWALIVLPKRAVARYPGGLRQDHRPMEHSLSHLALASPMLDPRAGVDVQRSPRDREAWGQAKPR